MDRSIWARFDSRNTLAEAKCVVAGRTFKVKDILEKGKHDLKNRRKKKFSSQPQKCNMKTAVCTHDSYNIISAKDSNTLHLCWLAACCFVFFTPFFFVVFHTWKPHSALAAVLRRLGQPGKGVLPLTQVTQGPSAFVRPGHPAAHDESMDVSVFFHLFLLVSQRSKNVSTSIACSREDRPAAAAQLEVCKQSTYIHYTKRGVT